MADIHYCAEKFGAAIHSIVCSAETETVQERVCAALGIGTLESKDFPPEIRPKYQKFKEMVTRVANENIGSYKASANAMSAEEACTPVVHGDSQRRRIHVPRPADEEVGISPKLALRTSKPPVVHPIS